MKTIRLSADEALLEAAEKRARDEHTTLGAEFQRWLADYACRDERVRRFDEAMAQLRGTVRVGKKLSRDEMNER